MLSDKVSTKKKLFARKLRKNMTEAEAVLWDHIRKEQLGYRMKSQRVLRGFIADFYCPAAKLVIEVDGGYHLHRGSYDLWRDDCLRKVGIETIRFTNEAVLRRTESVLAEIRRVIVARIDSGVKRFPFCIPIP